MVNKNDLSFNNLPKDERLNILIDGGELFNPFEIPDGVVLWNPFTFIPITKEDGEFVRPIIPDGETIFRNPFSGKITTKVLFKDDKPVKAWTVNGDNEWEVIIPKDDGTYDVSCLKAI